MPTALVLSAAGMFGAWQAGAWKALSECFRPDLVAGSSAGALNGWAIAGGCPPGELIERWTDPRSADTMRPGFPSPRRGLFRPDALERVAREMCERYQPQVPFGGTVEEIPKLRLRLVREHDVTWRHLLAMCSVPFLFPPVRIDGKRYVDGGLLSVLPLWAAAEMGATRIIALDALPRMPSRVVRGVVAVARRFARPAPDAPAIEILHVQPEADLGTAVDAVRWNSAKIGEWIRKGESDLKLALCRTSGSIA